MKNYLSIMLLLLTLSTYVYGQSGRPAKIKTNESTKIALADILGDWYPNDSLVEPQITFRQIGNAFVEIEGIKDGVGNYMFSIERDSILINGIAINWPPYDCTLKLLKSNLLEIVFSQYFYTGGASTLIYKR